MFATDVSIDIVELAREAEARGLQSLWLPEHTHIPVSRRTPPPTGDAELAEEYKRCLDPLVALAAAASATTTLRLGTGILLAAQREPIVTAKAVATLDHLSGGRAALGVGFGWNEDELEHHGVAMARPAGRRPRADPRHAGAVGRRRGQLRRRARAASRRAGRGPSRCRRRRRPAAGAGPPRRRGRPEAVRPHRRVRRRLDPDRRRRPHRGHPAAAGGGGRGGPRSRRPRDRARSARSPTRASSTTSSASASPSASSASPARRGTSSSRCSTSRPRSSPAARERGPARARSWLGTGSVPADELGHGGEAVVYALDAERVLRVHRHEAADHARRIGELYAALDRSAVPYALPEVLEVHGDGEVSWSIERRLPGPTPRRAAAPPRRRRTGRGR